MIKLQIDLSFFSKLLCNILVCSRLEKIELNAFKTILANLHSLCHLDGLTQKSLAYK